MTERSPAALYAMKRIRGIVHHVSLAVVLASMFQATAHAEEMTISLLQSYCVDCHGSQDEEPEAGFSLTMAIEAAPLEQSGPIWKKALDAIDGHEMPPSDMEPPTSIERTQLIEGIRRILSKPSLKPNASDSAVRDPGHPVLRRMTRLEYNNSVRDLLGLDTDVLMFSERLPFGREHFRPAEGVVPDRLKMGAREYGAKYPVLLRDASMPGDSRAEYGFSNRGDAQNLSAVRLAQYVGLAGEIAFHPELLSRARRMEELFPEARYKQPSSGAAERAKPLATSSAMIATNDNVARTAERSDLDLEEFRGRLASAFAEDRGGVFSGEELRNTKIAGKGGLIRVAYGRNATRAFAINPNEDVWLAPFATAFESSGDTLLANYKKQQRIFELTFQGVGSGRFAGIAELGIVLLSRRGEQGTIRLKATLDDNSTQELEVELRAGLGVDNTFVAFVADDERTIRRLAIDGSEYSGDYVLLDDLCFVTRDAPNRMPLVQAEEPDVVDEPDKESPDITMNRTIAKESPSIRLEHFLRRAFRRDVRQDEVELYLSLYQAEIEQGGNDQTAMRRAIQGVLSSPSFLYLASFPSGRGNESIGFDDRDEGLVASPTTTVTQISDHSLASRLSYFLWSTMPDDELLELASTGKLGQDDVLETQVQRMLQDRRSVELAENFYVQWLRLAELWSAQPDSKLFPSFYSAINNKRTLAQDMFGESLLQFQTILVEDRPITDLIDSEYTFVNGKLLRYYGCDLEQLRTWKNDQTIHSSDAKDDGLWHRVKKFDDRRGGVVTSPAVLTLTSFPHRTSSIRRGVWILDTLFNRHPPAPQVAVADIDEQENADDLTLREKVELHRANSACAACHDRIDPPGFALENFDAIGRWRDNDGDDLIDASGELAGVGEFSDAVDFKSALISSKERFVRGFTEHMLSFALGRKLEYFDTPAVEEIVKQTMEDECRLSTLVVAITKSYPFRNIQLATTQP